MAQRIVDSSLSSLSESLSRRDFLGLELFDDESGRFFFHPPSCASASSFSSVSCFSSFLDPVLCRRDTRCAPYCTISASSSSSDVPLHDSISSVLVVWFSSCDLEELLLTIILSSLLCLDVSKGI